MVIKAAIFDCFGVLTTDGWIAFKNRHFKKDPDLFAKATELNGEANSARISYQEFLAKIGELAGMPASGVEQEINSNVANDELFGYIKTLKPKYKIGMLSNASANWLKDLFNDEQISLFDTIDLSYESGVIKPEEQSYVHVAEQLGVNTNECVFIDDQEKHCEGARRAGLQAIRYENFEQMKKDLEKILAAGSNN
jgi:HAD superfamily hydrolase (TIGR01509 family)